MQSIPSNAKVVAQSLTRGFLLNKHMLKYEFVMAKKQGPAFKRVNPAKDEPKAPHSSHLKDFKMITCG